MKRKFVLLLVILTVSSLFAIDVPPLEGRINDLTGTLSRDNISNLELILEGIEETTHAQVAVLLVNSLEGDSIEEFSMRVVDRWKLGGEKSDNGVLLLVALGDRKLRIEVGYGLEGALTDAKSHYIIRNVITPYFKSGEIAKGIEEGVLAIGGVITNDYEITPEELVADTKKADSGSGSIPLIFLFMILFSGISMFSRVKRIQRASRQRGSGSGGFLALLIMELLLGGRRHGSGSISIGGGSSFSDGGGFGGFSGGGGSFGGGGASGGW